jgi:hypothetical protein
MFLVRPDARDLIRSRMATVNCRRPLQADWERTLKKDRPAVHIFRMQRRGDILRRARDAGKNAQL